MIDMNHDCQSAPVESDVRLLPCPFCGHEPLAPENENEGSRRNPIWVIRCESYCISMRRNTKNDVTHDWNTRAA